MVNILLDILRLAFAWRDTRLYSEPHQITKMKLLVKIVKRSQPLTNFVKSFILEVRLGSNCTPETHFQN